MDIEVPLEKPAETSKGEIHIQVVAPDHDARVIALRPAYQENDQLQDHSSLQSPPFFSSYCRFSGVVLPILSSD